MRSFKRNLVPYTLLVISMFLHTYPLSAAENNLSQKIELYKQQEDKRQALAFGNEILASKQITLSQKIKVLENQASIYFTLGDFTQSIIVTEKIKLLAQHAQLMHVEAKAHKKIGVYHYYKGESAQALASYHKALVFFKSFSDVIQQANLLNNIGLVESTMGNTLEALEHYEQAEAIYEEHGSEIDKIDIRYNIATLYIRLRLHKLAIEVFLDIIEKRIAINDDPGLASVHLDIGVSYKQAGQYQVALEYMLKALTYYQAQNDLFNLASAFHNLSEVYNEMNQPFKAQHYAEKAIEISEPRGYNNSHSGSLNSLAKSFFYQGDFQGALSLLEQSSQIAQKTGYKQQLTSNVALFSLIHASLGEPVKALSSQREFVSLYNQRANKALTEQLARFESEQLKQQVIQLQQSKKLQQLEVEKSEQQKNFIILAALLFLFVAFFFYRRNADIRLKHALKIQVKQRTNELESRTQELKQANTVKSQFLANMSHEIRTPLTAVIGEAEAILCGDVPEKFIFKEVKIIHDNSLHLLELINNILDLSKVEANKLELELQHQDLHMVLVELANMFTEQAKAKGLLFEITHKLPQPFMFEFDSFRVKQILINLCSNALKFTSKGSISINISIVEKSLFFKVQDTGIGLSYSQVQQVFESFTQGDSSISRRFGGSGLGLCLSEQLARLMKGRIEVESTLNQGSTFSFVLPCNYHDEIIQVQTIKKIAADIPVTQKSTFSGEILFADDHDDNRRLITRFLTTLGLDVITARDGKEALDLYEMCKPQVILLDIQMPEMDGIEAFTILRQKGCTIPIIALTANAMAHEVEYYLELGFDGHLKKPIERKQFIATLAKYYGEGVCHKEASDTLSNIDLSDLVAQFKSNLVLEQQDIIVHMKNDDLTKLATLAHRIAGAAQMFGFALLSEKAIKLELAIKANKASDVTELTQEFLNEIDQVLW